jgi:nucleoside-diphosphate-sugar epimerase
MFPTETALDEALSEPTPHVIDTLRRLDGDLLVLGVAGKMGPSLARMAKRAFDAAGLRRRVIGVARFTSGGEAELQAHGIETLRCNLLDEDAVAQLPEAPLVLYLAGKKFGSTGDEPSTWAQNSYLPGLIGRRYRHSRLVALSTGNVYGLASIAGGGSVETDPLNPVGEYAMSCLGRERLFQYVSQTYGTSVALIRLNYACDLRYGVLVDLAQRILADQPIDLAMGAFNTIWQGDANAQTLLAFAHTASPAWVVNVTGPEIVSVRDAAEQLGQRLHRPVRFVESKPGFSESRASQSETTVPTLDVGNTQDREARHSEMPGFGTALLSNCRRAVELWGPPRVSVEQLIDGVAAWLQQGGRTLNKPTHFEARDGKF